ncbi:MAG: phenylalanine--tRNA ligase beta subunit-related protein [Anaerovoracaceae bacterium]
MKFRVSNEFFDKIEDGCFGVVVARGIDNSKSYSVINQLLEKSVKDVAEKWQGKNPREDGNIELYREAFKKLDINPNKYMCSIEALAKRVAKGNAIPTINPLVDLGNALSLKYFVPLGAHDISKMEETIEIRYSNQDDSFVPFGETEGEKIEKKEIVYVSGKDVKTRMWIHRQGENGKITHEASDIFFPIDGFTKNRDAVILLRDELGELIKDVFGVEVKLGFVDKDSPEFEF